MEFAVAGAFGPAARGFKAIEATGTNRAAQKTMGKLLGQQVYRSGIGNPMSEMVAVQPRNLVGRNVRIITPSFRPGYCGPPACKSLTSRHFSQYQTYGEINRKFLENGRNRYYGIIKPPRVEGNMIGTRVVREWDPSTGLKRTWLETIDKNGTIRSVRLERNDGIKIHYIFDENGIFEGIR